MHSSLASKSPKKPRTGRKVDAAYLERAALYYLERFSSSAENLKRVLKRKIDRRCKLRGEEAAPFYPLIEPLVERYIASGLINDETYAKAQVSSLRRRGASARMIAAKLKVKGVKGEQVQTIVSGHEVDEWEAARNYARRRRLGPWRTNGQGEHRDKDLAALARAGFSFAHAKRALEEEGDVAN